MISLWMFLVIIFSVSKGDCRSSPKYVVANNKKSNQVNDNCFCFKYSGDYQKVPEILNNMNGNPERIVVFLYKDNSTDHMKMYIPNHEKQALIPDLAFEVGDKLNTIEPDQKVIDIFNINSRTIDNTPIPTDHEHPQVDGNNDDIYIDDGNYDAQPEEPDTYEVPSSEVNIPPVVPNDDDHHEPYDNADVDSHEIPSKEVIETPTIDVDDDTYYEQSDERTVDSSEVPSKVISVPPVTINTVDNIDHDDGQHDNSNIDYEIPSEEVNVPPIDVNSDDDDHHEHNHNPNPDSYEIPSKEVNVLPIDINADEDDHPEQHYNPDIDSNGALSKEVNVPLIDDTDYHVKPNIDSHEVPPMDINVDVDNYDWQQYNTDVDAEKVSSNEVNVPHITIDYSDEDQYEQYDKPNIDDGDYYEQHDQPNFDPNNVPPKVIHVDKDDHDKYSPIEINFESSDETSEESISNEDEMSLESQLIEDIGYSYETDVNGEKPHSNRNKTKPIHDKHNQNNYETFDRWFIHQMQRFKTYTKHDRAVSLLTIERYILKILHNNHMHVTAEGVLTDSYGTALDVRNLHLRPILIGNTMAFKSILNDVRDLVIPENMAYLQAILVTNSHPSMILGIIPIGKTIIPPSSTNNFSVLNPNPYSIWLNKERQRVHRPISKGSGSKNNIIGNARYYSSKKKPILVHLSRKTHKPVNLGRNIGRTIITVVEKKPVTVQSIHQKPITNIKVYGDNVLNGVNEFNLTDSSVEVFNKLLISLRNGEDPIRSAEATNKLLAALQNGGRTLTSPVEIGDKNDAGEEDITERIVGGKAATSSGTPLSMKGRMKDI